MFLVLMTALACSSEAPAPAAPPPAEPAAAPAPPSPPPAPAAGARAADSIRIRDAYARAMPPTATNSAAFLTLESGVAARLVAARSDVAASVELHTHVEEGGVMQMRQIPEIELPAGQTVELKPGGLHVMFVGLTRPLVAGEELELTLVFGDGSEHALRVPIREIAPAGAHGG